MHINRWLKTSGHYRCQLLLLLLSAQYLLSFIYARLNRMQCCVYAMCALRAIGQAKQQKRERERERKTEWCRLPDQEQVCAHRKCLQMCQVQGAVHLELCRWRSQRNQNNSGSNSTSSQELKGHLTASQTPFACKCRRFYCCNCKWHDSRRRAAMAAGKWTCLVANEIRSVQRQQQQLKQLQQQHSVSIKSPFRTPEIAFVSLFIWRG